MIELLYTIIIYPIIQVLEFSYFVPHYLFAESGISVIFISIVISILCLPLYSVAEKWQQIQRNTEKKLKPKIDKIKSVFKGDEQYMVLSAFYRQNNYHPIYALRSSFGLFIQIPFFIAAYSYLSHLELLQDKSFLIIRNLGSPDALLSINGLTINLLPVVMTLINCIAGAIYTKGFSLKDKIQLYGISVIFLVLLYNSPSALVLYWTMNNFFSLIKNIYYKINFKNKPYLLAGLFSFVFILFSLFFITKYGYSYKGQRIFVFCLLLTVVPWTFFLLKKQCIKITNYFYDPRRFLLIFLFSGILVFFLFGLFIPSQLIVSSPQEFSFIDNYGSPLYFIYHIALQFFGLFIFWPLCIYFLFSDDFKKIFSPVFTALSFCFIVNVFLFSGKYGIISIDFFFSHGTGHSITESLTNIFVLIIVFFITYFISIKKNKNIILTMISLLIFSTLCISIYNINTINTSFNKLKTFYTREDRTIEEISPVFNLSKNGKNVVVIMLDRAISVFIPFIFEELPELREKYSGFIYYPNTVSFHGYTGGGAPPVYGGYEYTPDEMYKDDKIQAAEKYNQSLLLLPRIFSENNFLVYITDPPYANLNWKSDLTIYRTSRNVNALITDGLYTDIWINEHGMNLPETSTIIKRNMAWYSLFRGMPMVLRDLIYMRGNWCSPISNGSLRLAINGYSVLNYMPRLTAITENTDTALIITNNTTHENSFFQAPEYVPVMNVTNYGTSRFSKEKAYHVNIGSINRLADWFDFLKNENIYDNTRIIIVSDHGPEPNFVTKIGLPFNVDQYNPLLMVKDFNASGETITDMTFMSNADVPSLALDGIIDNPVNPFTGNAISMDRKNEPLYIVVSGSMHVSDIKNIFGKGNYLVHDNIFVAENWIPATGY